MDIVDKFLTKKRILQIILGVLLIYSINVSVIQYSKFQKKARESPVKLYVEAFRIAENSYYQEWKRFTPVLEDIGFVINSSMSNTQILTKPEHISPDELKFLGDNVPFVQDHAYKVIVKYVGRGLTGYWTLDHAGVLVKILEVPKQ